MAISSSEHTNITCPACGEGFIAELWVLVDTAERPELRDALLAGTLNQVQCTACSTQVQADLPLLVHDPATRRVYFAAPAAMEEHAWHERAQELLYALGERLPEDQHPAYLNDVDIAQDVEGLRRAVQRRSRRGAKREQQGVPPGIPVAAPQPAQPVARAKSDTTELMDAIQNLLAADSNAEFRVIVAARPELLTPGADSILAELFDQAQAQGERDTAQALRQVRTWLAELRSGTGEVETTVEPAQPPEAAEERSGQHTSEETIHLSDLAYQSLVQATSQADLVNAVRDYPALLEPWVEPLVAARAEAALDEGNERLAQLIEGQSEVLQRLRTQLTSSEALLHSVQALMRATNEDAIEQTITEHPALLTEAAQITLMRIAASARAQGDTALGMHADECRSMLQTVREGLVE